MGGPRGRQILRREHVLMAFRHIEQWDKLLTEAGTECVRALRTKTERMSFEDMNRLVLRRTAELRRRKSAKVKPAALGPLMTSPVSPRWKVANYAVGSN